MEEIVSQQMVPNSRDPHRQRNSLQPNHIPHIKITSKCPRDLEGKCQIIKFLGVGDVSQLVEFF